MAESPDWCRQHNRTLSLCLRLGSTHVIPNPSESVYIAVGPETWQVGAHTITLGKGDTLTIPYGATPVRRLDLLPVQYDRAVLMDVVNHHHKVEIKGCICGWAALGRTIGEHVADVYEQTLRER